MLDEVQRLRIRWEFLKELHDLMEEYNAVFSVDMVCSGGSVDSSIAITIGQGYCGESESAVHLGDVCNMLRVIESELEAAEDTKETH